MKKMALLFALTLLCAGQLYGMERPEELNLSLLRQLPEEIRLLSISALVGSGNNLDEAVNNIKIASVTNKKLNQMVSKKYGNLKGFTTLAHILADKFNTSTHNVASKFNTPIAKQYEHLGHLLLSLRGKFGQPGNLDYIKNLIQDGADVNFISRDGDMPLRAAIHISDVEIVNFLLESGAKPTDDDLDYTITVDKWEPCEEAVQIIQIIENAMHQK